MPTLSVTFAALRRRLANSLDDLITFTAASGSATQCTANVRDHFLLSVPGALVGSELSVTAGTGPGQTTSISAHTVSSDTATLTFDTVGTALSTDSVVEIVHLNGRGWRKVQYDNAINTAISMLTDYEFTDTGNITLAIEKGSIPSSGTATGIYRRNYPMPSGFAGVWGVDLLSKPPLTVHGPGAMTTTRAFGDAAARTRVGQGFQIPQRGLIGYIAVYMWKVGTPTDNITIVVETNSSNVPSGTAVTNGTSDTFVASSIPDKPGWVVFTFDPPMLLNADTTYHWTLRRSAAVSASNYFLLAEDASDTYGDGDISLYDSSAWAATATSDFCFAVSVTGSTWVELAPAYWKYNPAASDELYIAAVDRFWEGTPIRIRGGAAISTTSTETDNIPARPEWIEKVARIVLQGDRTGHPSGNNHAAGLEAQLRSAMLWPPAARPFPANWVHIR